MEENKEINIAEAFGARVRQGSAVCHLYPEQGQARQACGTGKVGQ